MRASRSCLSEAPAQDDAAAAAEDAQILPAPLPAKLLNNAAVLHMRAGETAAALELVQEAIAARPRLRHGACTRTAEGRQAACASAGTLPEWLLVRNVRLRRRPPRRPCGDCMPLGSPGRGAAARRRERARGRRRLRARARARAGCRRARR